MRVIAVSALRDFWELHPRSEQPLKTWFEEARFATWQSPLDIKRLYRSASVLKSGRVVFNIAGNNYRLVVAVLYDKQTVLIKFVGTHDEYNRIDAQTVNMRGRH